MKTSVQHLLMLLVLFFLGGCQQPPVPINDLRDAYDKAVKSKEEMLALQAKQAQDCEDALKAEQQALLDRVQLMSNAAFEAQLANSQNPQPNNFTHIVGVNLELVAANSPKPPTAAAMEEARKRLPVVEAAKTNDEIDNYYKGKFEEATQAWQEEKTKRDQYEQLVKDQSKELQQKQGEVVSKFQEGMKQATHDAEQLKGRLQAITRTLYKQLVWIFGLAAVVAGGGCIALLYLQRPRMALYSFLASIFFGGCAFLTVWLQENQWVVWVLFAIGVCALLAMLILRHGYNLRNQQLVSMAGKRDALDRIIVSTGKTLQDFGLKAGETLQSLDLHELEELQDRLIVYFKANSQAVPDLLKS